MNIDLPVDAYGAIQRKIARLELASEIASMVLEGDSEELHLSGLSGWQGGRRRKLPKAQAPTAVQRARLAAAVLERGRLSR